MYVKPNPIVDIYISHFGRKWRILDTNAIANENLK